MWIKTRIDNIFMFMLMKNGGREAAEKKKKPNMLNMYWHVSNTPIPANSFFFILFESQDLFTYWGKEVEITFAKKKI